MNLSDGALSAAIAGVAAVAFELMWPGFLLPGVAGMAALLGGLFLLCSHAVLPLYMTSGVVGACVLFVFENWSPVRWLSGMGATTLFTASLWCWSRTSLAFSVPASLIAGCCLTYLLYRTKLARTSKLDA